MAQLMYKGEAVKLRLARYDNDRLAIQMLTMSGEPYTRVTVNLPDTKLAGENLTFIKNHSENEGMLEWLINNQLCTDTGMRIQSGYASIPVVRLTLPEGLEEY